MLAGRHCYRPSAAIGFDTVAGEPLVLLMEICTPCENLLSVNTIEAAMLAAVTIDLRKRFERMPPLTKQCSACGEIKIDRNDMVRTGTFGQEADVRL